MARPTQEGDDLVVRLSWAEKLATGRREVRVPVSAVRGVRVEHAWWRGLRGVSGRGVWLPSRWYAGVRRLPDGGKDFVVIRAAEPVWCADLRDGAPYRRLAVSVPDPEEVRRKLTLPMSREA